MARKRMIDPNIWSSAQFMKLSLRQRLLFIGLISNADDEGCLRGEPLKVKALIFPGDLWTEEELTQDLRSLCGTGLIHWWEYKEELFIDLPNWNKYQKMNYKSDSHLRHFNPKTDEGLRQDCVSPSPQVREVREVREVSKKDIKTSASGIKSERSSKQKSNDFKLELVKEIILHTKADIKTHEKSIQGFLKLFGGDAEALAGAILEISINGHPKNWWPFVEAYAKKDSNMQRARLKYHEWIKRT